MTRIVIATFPSLRAFAENTAPSVDGTKGSPPSHGHLFLLLLGNDCWDH